MQRKPIENVVLFANPAYSLKINNKQSHFLSFSQFNPFCFFCYLFSTFIFISQWVCFSFSFHLMTNPSTKNLQIPFLHHYLTKFFSFSFFQTIKKKKQKSILWNGRYSVFCGLWISCWFGNYSLEWCFMSNFCVFVF